VLAPKQKKEVKITYECTSAKVLVSFLSAKLADGPNEMTFNVKLSAIGKYPFITVDNKSFDFGSLLVGKTASKELKIENSSDVPTTFTIEKIGDDGKDPSFTLSHYTAAL
jgi:cilia- and flagella-associated protein 65